MNTDKINLQIGDLIMNLVEILPVNISKYFILKIFCFFYRDMNVI